MVVPTAHAALDSTFKLSYLPNVRPGCSSAAANLSELEDECLVLALLFATRNGPTPDHGNGFLCFRAGLRNMVAVFNYVGGWLVESGWLVD
jgi:hypothetical protein